MIAYLFRVLEGSTLRQAKAELSRLGLSNIYCIEDEASGEILLGGTGTLPLTTPLKHSLLAQSTSSSDIDWASQWANFAENFYEGKAHIDLTRFGGVDSLLLAPGPGFGDLSHPTTYLMLQLMSTRVQRHPIVDIGCGSGILTLAALRLGAISAIGIDIDPAALDHARENAALNQLNALFTSEIPPQQNAFLLMNMILPEQRQVMKKAADLNAMGKQWITSGILTSQRKEYLSITHQWGWNLCEERQQGEWLGFIFDIENSKIV